MIFTITLNPSLNKTVGVEELMYDDVNVILGEDRSAGGKGIDVSRVIKELGGQSIALGFMGGYNGLEVEGRLANEGILCDFTRVSGETRTNLVIHQQRKKIQTLLSSSCPQVTQFDVTTLYRKIKHIPKDSYVVMSGNLPPGLNENFYAQIITGLKVKGVKAFLDADGDALKTGVQAGPYLIKPNIHEFGRLIEGNVKDQDGVLERVAPYLDVVDAVVVSMGARGAIGISRKERCLAVPPKVSVKSAAGAGDALLAVLVFALSEGASFKDALCLGVACGTASTLNAGSALCLKDDVYAIKKEVSVKNV
jgi:6-phosphofructokinase 2